MENQNDMFEQVASQEETIEVSVRQKKPYEKPAFLYRAPLEAMAVVCVPSPGKTGSIGCAVPFS